MKLLTWFLSFLLAHILYNSVFLKKSFLVLFFVLSGFGAEAGEVGSLLKSDLKLASPYFVDVQSAMVGATPRPPNFVDRIWLLDGQKGGQCVKFIQDFFQYFDDCKWVNCFKKEFRGNAKDIEPNSNTPGVGKVVLLSYPLGHAAVIVGATPESLVLAESNYHLDERVTVGREVSLNDKKIRGYYEFPSLGAVNRLLTSQGLTQGHTMLSWSRARTPSRRH